MTFAERLKSMRKKRNLTQKELADILGIPYQGISQYERGVRQPKYQTIERIAKALEAEGVSGYVLNVGGNVRTIGRMSDGSPWQVQIENPNSSDIDNPYIESLYLSGEALVTSGGTQRSYTVNGVNYHHIIDKDTNYPAEGYLSVSVVSKDSGIGDALSTALFCVGVEQGIEILSHFEDSAAMWVLADGSIRYSEGFTEYRTLKS